jgi:hypothetical protein
MKSKAKSHMLSLSPYQFDQSPQGWRDLCEFKGSTAKDDLKAAEVIEEFLEQNAAKIMQGIGMQEGDKYTNLQTMHFHAGQCYAFAGSEHYTKAIGHFKQAYKEDSPLWNLYVDGSIAYLEQDQKTLATSI